MINQSLRKWKQAVGRTLGGVGIASTSFELAKLRRRFWSQPTGSLVRYLNYEVRITDGPNFYIQCKDEFIHRIYHFEAQGPEPLIIDGGSNIGMSILYFKHTYPKARLIGFEPDENIFQILNENVARNRLTDVTLIDAGLGAEAGTTTFQADNKAGGQFAPGNGSMTVRVERLSTYIKEPVDFLKLNIEGQELQVLSELETAGKLRHVREMVIEYHGWPAGEQRLGEILQLLDRSGYRYLVHDFDNETGHATKPPFRVEPDLPWFCLVYGKRIGD